MVSSLFDVILSFIYSFQSTTINSFLEVSTVDSNFSGIENCFTLYGPLCSNTISSCFLSLSEVIIITLSTTLYLQSVRALFLRSLSFICCSLHLAWILLNLQVFIFVELSYFVQKLIVLVSFGDYVCTCTRYRCSFLQNTVYLFICFRVLRYE